MNIAISAAAFIAGATIAFFVFTAAVRAQNTRWRKARRAGTAKAEPTIKRKFEFSKLILALVLLTYFTGVAVGVRVVLLDLSQLGVLLAFIGTPTAAAIGFYAWKAKAENIVKIKKENPEETAGIPIDVNNINV